MLYPVTVQASYNANGVTFQTELGARNCSAIYLLRAKVSGMAAATPHSLVLRPQTGSGNFQSTDLGDGTRIVLLGPQIGTEWQDTYEFPGRKIFAGFNKNASINQLKFQPLQDEDGTPIVFTKITLVLHVDIQDDTVPDSRDSFNRLNSAGNTPNETATWDNRRWWG